MATKSDSSTRRNSPFGSELAQTETILRDWRRDTERCHGEMQQWDGLRTVVDERRHTYRRLRTRIRLALRTAHGITRWLFPIVSSVWSTLRYRWLSARLWMLRVKIALIALAVTINRVVFWSLHVLVPSATVWAVILLAQLLWEFGSQIYFQVISGF